jgi:hypothetical protein
MTPPLTETAGALARVERAALLVGAAALLVAAAAAWMRPEAIAAAYRVAAFGCLAPAVGSLVFVLIFRMTGGRWAPDLLPYLRAGVRLAPWVWVLTLPLLAFPRHGLAQLSAPVAEARSYDSTLAYAIRGAVYAGGLFLLALGVRGAERVQVEEASSRRRWIGPVGLIALVLMLHLLVDDWVAELDPGWHSTAFPLVWIIGQALAGLSLAVAAAVLGGADVRARGGADRPLGIDWGNLLLAALSMWWYVAFAQFLIIWAGNLPHETSWFLRRAHGGWAAWVIALAGFHFALPFVFLLSRRWKRSRRGLASLAALLLGGQLAYVTWAILPAFTPRGWFAVLLAVAALVGALGLFLNRYVATARRLRVATP